MGVVVAGGIGGHVEQRLGLERLRVAVDKRDVDDAFGPGRIMAGIRRLFGMARAGIGGEAAATAGVPELVLFYQHLFGRARDLRGGEGREGQVVDKTGAGALDIGAARETLPEGGCTAGVGGVRRIAAIVPIAERRRRALEELCVGGMP